MSSSIQLALVVGAGASKEANLPIGTELKHKIARALDIRFDNGTTTRISGDDRIINAYRLLAQTSTGLRGDINPHLNAGRMISAAMPQAPSIDNFIDAHRGNPLIAECGKLGIARCILEAEAASSMRVDNRNSYNKLDFKLLENTWYNIFFRLLVEDCRVQDLAKRLARVAIVTFNYDRCIEHFLHASLRNYYGVSIEEATELLQQIRIYHAYGWLGPLDWLDQPGAVAYGAEPDPQRLISIAAQLKTFTEGTDESHSDIVAIRKTLLTAERLAFLGFGFNPQNLDLLFGAPGATVAVRYTPVFATALGLSESDVEAIAEDLWEKAGLTESTRRFRRDVTCAQLLSEYGRVLAIR